MNFTEVELESLESSLEHWILSDEQNMVDTFGEQLVGAVKEALVDD